MNRCAIITGGDYAPIVKIEECDFIIACDKGYKYCKENNIRADLLIGDFDSYDGEIPDDLEVIRLPVMKDDTDTMYAYRYAVEKGFKEIYLYCALGGRFDLLLANLQCAIYGAHNNISTYIYSSEDEILITNDDHVVIHKKEGYSLSLLAADICKDVKITGALYETDNIDLTNSFPLGVSNEFVKDEVIIEKKNGVIIIVQSFF